MNNINNNSIPTRFYKENLSNSPPNDLKSQISFLTRKIETLEDQLLLKTRENETLFLNKTSNELDFSEMKLKIADLEQKNLILTRENEYFRKITGNKSNIELKTTKIVEMEQNCAKLLQENSKLNEICKNSSKENEDLKAKIKEFQKNPSLKLSTYSEISNLSQKVLVLEKQLKEFKADNEFLSYKLRENSNKKLFEDQRNEMEKIMEELKNSKERISKISLENRDFENKFNQIEKELEGEKIKNLEIEKKLLINKENSEEISEKKFELARLFSEIEKKNEKIKELEIINERNQEKIEKMKVFIEELKGKNKENEKKGEINGEKFDKNEFYENFDKVLAKCDKLKQRNKALTENLKEKSIFIDQLKIYQEKYESLFQETKEISSFSSEKGENQMKIIVILAAENERLRELIRNYVSKQEFEEKTTKQYDKNLNEYNNLCIRLKEVERRNFALIEEKNALKLMNEQRMKEVNRMMIEASENKKRGWEENQRLAFENAKLQEINMRFSEERRFYDYY